MQTGEAALHESTSSLIFQSKMSGEQKCPHCGCLDIDYNTARGDAACFDCGHVIETSMIVNEVGFAEDARGRSNVIGQRVRADGRPATYGSLPGYSRQATELTMSNARGELQRLTGQLKLNAGHTDAAHRLFKLAVERNFHKGRRLSNVCCACLYVVCRMQKTPHMLLDFADALQTNVYVLGHTFLKFVNVLSLHIPIIDPSLYIHRFASKLEFGEKTHEVATTALRLVSRMQRDWLSHGRRPSSLCGAALLCAADLHQFKRTLREVCRVVRVGNVALRDRLQELNRTPTAALTAAQIEAGGGEQGVKSLKVTNESAACDPPAFERSQKKKERKRNQMSAERDETTGPNGGILDVEQQMAMVMASSELQQLDQESMEEERMDELIAKQRVEENGEKVDPKELAEKRQKDIAAGDISEEDAELSDLDDEDAAKYLNTETEFKMKEQLWTEINKDYLQQQEELAIMKRERPEEYRRKRPGKSGTKRKKNGTQKSKEDGNTVVEPPPRKISKKVNYEALRALNEETAGLDLLSDVGVSASLPPRAPS